MNMFNDNPEALEFVRKYVRFYSARGKDKHAVSRVMAALMRPIKVKFGVMSLEDIRVLRRIVEILLDEFCG